ncbi:hypothetical protein FACS1894217_08230 [Clostridia bacterium]|nr:hypothetical protein FACS1894217_08230 [Clostridia bacterium]
MKNEERAICQIPGQRVYLSQMIVTPERRNQGIGGISLDFLVTFICYPKCTTCQKARKWLDERGVTFDTRDIKQHNPTYDELKSWFAASGLPLKRFFNTSGLLYKSLALKDKLPTMTEDEQLELLATDGMLVKRPLLIGDGFVLVGFKESEWTARLIGAARQMKIWG